MGRLRSLGAPLPFHAVNRRGMADYDQGVQRHHLLPRQLLTKPCFAPMLDTIGRKRMGFDDFRSNGLLLPSSEISAMRIGLPLHRGPHRDYNAMVIERVGQVEGRWSEMRLRAPEIAHDEALLRLHLLQRALRRRLLASGRKPLRLNRHDRLGQGVDFTELDAMAEMLWPETEVPVVDIPVSNLVSAESLLLMADQEDQTASRAANSAFAF